MSFATNMRTVAANLASKLGNTATFSTYAESYNRTTGTNTRTPTTDAANIGGPFGYDEAQIDGDLVKAGDAKIYVSAADIAFTPAAEESVVINSKTWQIVRVTPFRANDTDAAFELQIRR